MDTTLSFCLQLNQKQRHNEVDEIDDSKNNNIKITDNKTNNNNKKKIFKTESSP